MSTLFLVAAPLLLATTLVSGCPSPKGKFEDFVKRTPNDMVLPPDLFVPSSVFDVTGTFLMSISTTLSPDMPLQFIVTNKLTPNNDGTASLEMTAKALTVAGRVVSPTNKDIVVTAPVSATGSFTADFGMRDVPGDANPISGSDITATLSLAGTLISKDRMCGDITGMVTKPLNFDLMGSKWGAIRVPDGTIGMALPPPEYTCGPAPADGGAPTDGSAD